MPVFYEYINIAYWIKISANFVNNFRNSEKIYVLQLPGTGSSYIYQKLSVWGSEDESSNWI